MSIISKILSLFLLFDIASNLVLFLGSSLMLLWAAYCLLIWCLMGLWFNRWQVILCENVVVLYPIYVVLFFNLQRKF